MGTLTAQAYYSVMLAY